MNEEEITPIEKRGNYFFKRDDFFEKAGVYGGKVRTCWKLCKNTIGVVTAGSKMSPQCNIVANIAKELEIPCRIHIPSGKKGDEIISAEKAGAEIFQHSPGYNTVIICRAKTDALNTGFTYIPFGMECQETLTEISRQVINIPKNVKRIIVPVGSGMTLAGILCGLNKEKLNIPIIGVVVGADPIKRLDKYAPLWRYRCELIKSNINYHKYNSITSFEGIELDPIYESKCIPFLKTNDMLWIVGIRQSIIKKVK